MNQKHISILMYHQIDKKPPKGSFLRGLVVSPATFSRHMAALHAIGYRGMSMSDLEPYLRGEKRGTYSGSRLMTAIKTICSSLCQFSNAIDSRRRAMWLRITSGTGIDGILTKECHRFPDDSRRLESLGGGGAGNWLAYSDTPQLERTR